MKNLRCFHFVLQMDSISQAFCDEPVVRVLDIECMQSIDQRRVSESAKRCDVYARLIRHTLTLLYYLGIPSAISLLGA